MTKFPRLILLKYFAYERGIKDTKTASFNFIVLPSVPFYYLSKT